MGGVLDGAIVTVMLSESVRPPESVTEAVIVCVPTDKLEVETVPPEPITPSMLEVQVRLPLKLPSSGSLAVPVKVTEALERCELLSAGAMIVAAGAVFGGAIVMVMLSESVKPPESVTEAVIVCVPTDRLEVETVPPEPIEPSILENQTRLPFRRPSSVSVAIPLKVTELPSIAELPLEGAVIRVSG